MDNWILIYESSFIHEIQIIKAVLDNHDIKNVIVNKTDSIYPMNGSVELYVMQEDALKSRHFIQSEIR